MNKKIISYIIAGGSGTRLAPLSLSALPKQFLPILAKETMLQEALSRVPKDIATVVVTIKKYEDIAKNQISEKTKLLLEPFGCNTAIAIGLSAIHALKNTGDPKTVLFIKPADHYMNKDYFQKYFAIASEEALSGKIVTIGITPTEPATVYGYIKTKSCRVDKYEDDQICEVEKFVEKPDYQTAQKFLESGDYFWNSGMFAFTIETILDKLKIHSPKIYESLLKIEKYLGTEKEMEVITEEYQKIKDLKENISIDYAVMEKEAENIVLVKAKPELKWNDIGGWAALKQYFPVDDNGNVSNNNVEFEKCKNTLAINYLPEANLALSGLDGLIAVATENGILVCPKKDSPRAKEIVEGLEKGEKEILIDCQNIEIKNKTETPFCVIGCEGLEINCDEKEILVKKK